MVNWVASLLVTTAGTSEITGQAPGSSTQPITLTRQELSRRSIIYLTMAGDQAYHSYYTIRAIQAYTEVLDLFSDSNAAPLTISRMPQKLGDAFSQRPNSDHACPDYHSPL